MLLTMTADEWISDGFLVKLSNSVNGTITVELNDAANGIVAADAIRVLIYQPQ